MTKTSEDERLLAAVANPELYVVFNESDAEMLDKLLFELLSCITDIKQAIGKNISDDNAALREIVNIIREWGF